MLRLLCPCSKLASYGLGKKRIRRLASSLEDVYRALTLLSSHIDDIQAAVWENSQKIVRRDTRVIFFDCTNSYFEIEDNDPIDPSDPGCDTFCLTDIDMETERHTKFYKEIIVNKCIDGKKA